MKPPTTGRPPTIGEAFLDGYLLGYLQCDRARESQTPEQRERSLEWARRARSELDAVRAREALAEERAP